MADVVVTGERAYDATSGTGKLVGSLDSRARHTSAKVVILAGTIDADVEDDVFAVSLETLAGSAAAALAEPGGWLRRAASCAASEDG